VVRDRHHAGLVACGRVVAGDEPMIGWPATRPEWKTWYKVSIPIADDRFAAHLDELEGR
jgi:hypothetical protein